MNLIDNIQYEVKRLKIKNMYICVKDGKIIVKAPKSISDDKITEFVNLKKKWIINKIKEFENNSSKEKKYIGGEFFKILGKNYFLKIEYSNMDKSIINLNNDGIEVILNNKYSNEKVKELIDKLYYKIALTIVDKSINMWKSILNISPDCVVIKKMKTAWGKCNFKRKITINPDLMKYDRKVVDYVILHELCHLRYMNHSKDFWNMVEKYLPDYKVMKKELKNVY